jgi:hypothetical protein
MGDLLGKMTEADLSKIIEEANKNSLFVRLVELLRDRIKKDH